MEQNSYKQKVNQLKKETLYPAGPDEELSLFCSVIFMTCYLLLPSCWDHSDWLTVS